MPLTFKISLIACVLLALQQGHAANNYEDWNLSALEMRLDEIDSELTKLPSMAMRSDSGAIGYRSDSPELPNPTRTEWAQIHLEHQQRIDEIVLVPIVRHDSQNRYQADGFPLALDIIAGTKDDSVGTLVARYTEEDVLIPRVAPLVIQTPGLEAEWVRIVATKIGTRGWDGVHVLQLAEVMLFQDGHNIALRQTVSVSSDSPGPAFKYAAYKPQYLVDGFVPYMMNGYEGTKSTAYFSNFPIETIPILTIDLEHSHTLDQINYHAIEVNDTIPQSNPDAYGIPKELLIEGAQKSDFSDATELVHYQMEGLNNRGPIMVFQFPPADYRYLKFTVLKTDKTNVFRNTMRGILGISEIEVLSRNENVALNKPFIVEAEGYDNSARNNTTPITDGHNFYGKILPMDQWMRELARRHDLEVERPLILEAIRKGYAQQKANLRLMGYLVASLVVGIIIIYLLGRLRAMRQIGQIRKRFAADLHDELGANLHAIGLLSDLAYEAADEKEKLQRIVTEVRTVTERTSDAVRYTANSQEARDPINSLPEDMLRIAKRMMHDITYTIQVEGEESLQTLKLRTRNDLFLFYKECLVNISRHSGATRFNVHLNADAKRIELSIEDNGQGYPPKPGAEMPPSLIRRAQIMHAQLNCVRPESGGTRITLILKRRRLFLFTK